MTETTAPAPELPGLEAPGQLALLDVASVPRTGGRPTPTGTCPSCGRQHPALVATALCTSCRRGGHEAEGLLALLEAEVAEAAEGITYLTGCSNPTLRAVDRGDLGVLVQPKTNSMVAHVDDYAGGWAADNGAFSPSGNPVPTATWWAWLTDVVARRGAEGCRFATAPDAVEVAADGTVRGDAAATLVLSAPWLARIRQLGLPAALVAQDGLEALEVPWDDFDVLFVGGSDAYKTSPELAALVAEAKARGKYVHLGRVNTKGRLRHAAAIGCDSADGTTLRYTRKNLGPMLRWLDEIQAEGLWGAAIVSEHHDTTETGAP